MTGEAARGTDVMGNGRPRDERGVGPQRCLAPVDVADSRIIRRMVGLRPFRPAGFCVKPDVVDHKPVVHNYGHGGGGISVSWGCAHLAAELADAHALVGPKHAAVLGSGVAGLSTARLLQRHGWRVTLYARDLPPHTTSDVAGAQWGPSSMYRPDQTNPAFIEQFIRATRLAYRAFQDLVGPEYGVRWIDGYYLASTPPRPPREGEIPDLLPEIFAGAIPLESQSHPFAAPYAWHMPTMLIEPTTFLNAVLRDVRTAGGQVVMREFTHRAEIATLPEPLVVNSTGLGSRDLFGDDALTPVKGQLALLQPQPEVNYTVVQDDLYMIPRSDGILLGGTFEHGEWSHTVNEEAERRVLNGHRRLFTALRS